jgi:hypothetical protein
MGHVPALSRQDQVPVSNPLIYEIGSNGTDGWKVFGTLARSISGVERRQAVEFGGVPLLVV